MAVDDYTENADCQLDQECVGDFDSKVVALHRIMSGKVLLDMICDSVSGKLCCEIEPTAENIEALSVTAETIEGLIQNPWTSPTEAVSISVANRLRKAVAITAQLTTLDALGIGVFAGSYMAMIQVPRYDVDEGHMYTMRHFPFEPVTMCRVVLSKPNQDRVVMEVTDKWMEPTFNAGVADDFPF